MPTTKLLPETVLNKIKKNKSLYQAARGVRSSIGRLIGARKVPGINGRVHFNDFMLDSTRPEDVERYRGLAVQLVGDLEDALRMAGRSWADVKSVLEFGCGYGRVTRALLEKVPPAKVTVCDVIAEGSAYCGREFKVRVIPSTPEIENFEAEPSDLVFFISVQTHLSERRLEILQKKLIKLVNPGGVCFFTTMGLPSANNTERYGVRWVEERPNILKQLRERGISFFPYGYYDDAEYGMAWHTREYMTSLMTRLHGDAFRLLHFAEAAQDNHQDIYVYQRVG